MILFWRKYSEELVCGIGKIKYKGERKIRSFFLAKMKILAGLFLVVPFELPNN